MTDSRDPRGKDAEHRNALRAGHMVHWYRVERVLGQGGFGITYLARDTNLDQDVAIKEYLPMELAVREGDHSVHPASQGHGDRYRWGLDRFLAEARTLARFKHAAIVRVLSVFEANNTAYMVIEYERGESLQDLLSRRKTLAESEINAIVFPIIDGLKLIHEAGFIHRDIKPANVVIRGDGSAVLIDFGSARKALGQETRTLTSIVSPGYAPYEQYYSKSDRQGPWTDIYGLGATLYRAVAGRAPMDAIDRSDAIIRAQRDVLVQAVDLGEGRYSRRLLAAIDHALRFNEKERPQTVTEWLRDFGVDGDAEAWPSTTPLAPGLTGSPESRGPPDTDRTNFAAGAQAVSGPPSKPAATVKLPVAGPDPDAPRRAIPPEVWAVLALAAAALGYAYYRQAPLVAPSEPVVIARPPPTSPEPVATEPAVPEPAPGVSPPTAAPEAVATEPIPEPASAEIPSSIAADEPAPIELEAPVEPVLPEAAPEMPSVATPPALQVTPAPVPIAEAPAPEPVTATPAPTVVDAVPTSNSAPVTLGPEERIAALLAQAEVDIKAGRLTTPREESAYARYQEVLQLAPDNAAARQGLTDIADRYARLAGRSIAAGELDKAGGYLDRGEGVLPGAESLKQARAAHAAAVAAQEQVQAQAEAEPATPAPETAAAAEVPPPVETAVIPEATAPAVAEPPPAPTAPAQPRLALRVLGVSEEFRRYGLDAEELHATVRDQLVAAGYEVVAFESAPPEALAADLNLHYNYNSTTGIYSFSASFKVRPLADAQVNPRAKPLWERGGTGWANAGEMAKIRGVFLDAVGRFVADQPIRGR